MPKWQMSVWIQIALYIPKHNLSIACKNKMPMGISIVNSIFILPHWFQSELQKYMEDETR